MSEKFEREERYIVFKVKDLSEHKLGWVRDVIRLNDIPTVDAVVVEADWPEYEPTWTAIERRVTGGQWNGEGLPPTGTVCMGRIIKPLDGEPRWQEVQIIHLDEIDGEAVGLTTSGRWPCWLDAFRPIPTPEQIAAEERKTAINQMAADAQLDFSAGELLTAREYVECAIAALHDAGYRKQVAP
ncbi:MULTISPECIES: hypothetical protein [unclassified Pseudomonas]|uniref:hypothetical protein n=1 Tax=unclassified Pseudomonas TaxID=196821 RepID=UPI0015B1B687|nr:MULTISPECIES: hypothetical protein [unclassified Pseudomonas]